MRQELREEIESSLRETRAQWEQRLEAIRSDRRHAKGDFDRDLDDQAIQRENDEPLDALDARGREELAAIDAALTRLAEGGFGACTRCGGDIAIERLRSRPTAETCIDCAQQSSGAPR
jgi:RNA polymerase-binding protein DksA